MLTSRLRALVVASLVVVLGVAGLSAAGAATAASTPTLHITGKGRTLPLARDHQVRLNLDTAVDGGYSWAVTQRPDSGVATIGRARIVTDPAPPGVVGQPAQTYYRVTAKGVGRTVITLVERRPTDHSDVVRRVTITVVVPRYPAFYGEWDGHTRYLFIDRLGAGVEHVGDGCCDPLIDLSFQLSNAHVVGGARVATITVVDVTVHKGWQETGRAAPRPGDRGTLRLSNGLLHERLSGAFYCDPAQSEKGTCGA